MRLELGSARVLIDAGGSVSVDGEGLAVAVVQKVLGVPAAHERTIDVDMTNWARVVDERWVVKIGSTLGSLDRSARQLELLAGSGVAPDYLGGLEVGGHVVATVSEYVLDSTDGWTWAVDDIVAHLRGGERPTWPAKLGRLSAEMHARLAVAGGGAAPDGARLRERAMTALDEALAVTTGPPAERLRNRQPAIEAAIASIPDHSVGSAFELHGDLHVGQVLRAGDRYVVLDFDGDPQLPAHERNAPDVAARDLAHLMSSLEMVAAVVMKHVGVHPRVLEWARDAQRALLRAYRERSDLGDPAQLDFLHAEQLLLELIYAHRFLPRWQYAADAAITFRFPPVDDSKEDPWIPPASSTT